MISTQVLIELRSFATRKLRPPLSDRQISALLEALCGFEVVNIDGTLVLDAHQLASNEQLSWFDALIAAYPWQLSCRQSEKPSPS